jgi:two-component system, NarL family, response regulator NreC
MSRIRVLIADDHGVVRKGIAFLLSQEQDIECVGEAGDGREAVQLASQLKPNVVIMDIAMPNLNGIDAAALITREGRTNVIIVSMHSEEEFLLRALSAGAKGYLLKDSAETELIPAVRALAAGRTFFSRAIADMLLEDYVRRLHQAGVQDSYDLLTDREKEVLQLLAEGKSNKEAAQLLNVSPHTVETHRTRFMQKLDLHNTAEIVIYAMRKKIVS